jgi:hypothetical protein
MYLVLIETSGNQNYIFSTNKLKENIGASELTYRASTIWVLEAVDQVRGASESIHQVGKWVEEAIDNQISANDLRKKLLDEQEWNQPIELENTKVEIIIATSGKALFLTKDEDVAKSIIRYVTHKATRYAPGLDICGVIHDFEWGEGLSQAVKEIYKKYEEHRSYKTSLHLRFLRLPVFDECATSGLPATEVDTKTVDGKSVVRSSVSLSKRRYGDIGRKRIENLLKIHNKDYRFSSSIRALNEEEFGKSEEQDNKQKNLDWLAVIHADGNGLGEIFLSFDKHIEQKDKIGDRTYANALREFCIALDICNEKAFMDALEAFPNNKKGLISIVPLVLGGDDLTVVCDGENAIQFTKLFLNSFEQETSNNEIIAEIAEKALKVRRLSACAGIAIIKPKFPFSVAYELAEKLMQSAKEVKKKVTHSETSKPYPCSAFDFHILYDSSNVDFQSIRSKIETKSENIVIQKLHNRPYVVTDDKELQGAKGLEWAKFHQFSKLEAKIKALTAKDENDDNKRLLPNSQIHELNAGLFLGKSVADARYLLIRDRYPKELTFLAGSENSLFQKEPDSEIDITGLLDAIDAAEFVNLEDKNNEQKA